MGWVSEHFGRESTFAQSFAAVGRTSPRRATPRIFDRRDPLLIVAQLTILAGVGFVLAPDQPRAERDVGLAILCLLGILAIHLYLPPTEKLVAAQGRGWPHLLGTTALLLLANWFVPTFGLLILFFMLTAEAFAWLTPPGALLLIVPTLPAIELSRYLAGYPARTIAREIPQLILGVVFSAAFSLVITSYYRQRRRAESLAEQLALSNRLLHAATAREKVAAAAEERLRIARDLHDGLGHHLTILAVQLQVAEKLRVRDPEGMAEALTASRREVDAALGTARETVTLLRHERLDPDALDAALRALVERVARQTAISADYRRAGTPHDLSEPVALLLQRAAQEGLTNAQKYAPGAAVTVTLRYSADAASLTVENAAATATPSASGGGFGIVGLRERAEGHGGTVVAGPRAAGFALSVTIPRIAATGQPA